MADNVTLNAGSGGATLAADDIGGVLHQRVKIQHGADASATDVSSASPLPVDLGANNDVTVTSGSITANAGTDLNTSALALETGGNLATVAGAVSGTEMQVDIVAALPAGTNAIGKLAANSGVDIGDVDVITFPTTVHSADFDTGAGTDTTLAFGVALPASGGAVVCPGDATAGLKVDLGADNDVTVTGPVTANAGTDLNTSALALETGGNLATVAGAVSGTEMQVDVVAALPAGTNAIGKLAANSGVDIGDVDVTSISAGSNLVGDVGLSGARTSGGTTLYKNIDVDQTEDEIKATAGQVYWIHAVNLAATARFLKFYNATAANVTVGTTVPDLTFAIPTQGDTNGAGFTLSIPNGIEFGTAITIAATTGVADADSGAPGANEVIVNLGYA